MTANIFFGSQEEKRDDLLNITNQYTNKIVSQYPRCTPNDATKALQIAQKASIDCKNSSIAQRVDWLNDVANILEKQSSDFANTITNEVGKPIAFSKIEVSRAIETIRLSANAIINLHGKTINTNATPSGKKTTAFYKRVPVGVVVCITPFNFPLNLIIHKIAPALAAGNAVVLKPTPEAPLIAYKLVKLFVESKYAIKDAISLIYGDGKVGNALVCSDVPRVISFTGSATVGKIITQNAGIKKISLELGGNAATFIDKSANIEIAANRCAFGAFYNSGQVCISLQRIYVHTDIYDEFVQQLRQNTSHLKVGDPYLLDTFMGPLINDESVTRAQNWIQSAMSEGAKLITGGFSNETCFYPTIMGDVKEDMKIICEEVFAPIVSLIKVDNYDQAISKMNNSPFGLQFSIFTNDLSLVNRFINDADAGGVVINDIPTLRFDIQPYGGVKLSGIGREGPEFALEEFTEIKSVIICDTK